MDSNYVYCIPSFKLTAKAPEAMDGWNTILSFWCQGQPGGCELVVLESSPLKSYLNRPQ